MNCVSGCIEFRTQFKDIQSVVLAIGNFDGLHLGHHQVLTQAKKTASILGAPTTVLTFKPHPQTVVFQKQPIELILTYEERKEWFSRAGIDFFIEEPFNLEFSEMEPEKFIQDHLIDLLHPKAIVVGYDFCFGKSRKGNLSLLKTLCQRLDVELHVVPAFVVQGEVCSSTNIRKYLFQGEIEKANQCLGRPFSYKGTVIRGKSQGKKLGWPTANMLMPSKLKLSYGVYWTYTVIDENRFESVTHIGVRPTVEATPSAPCIESHLFDFDQNLYEKCIKIEFLKFHRPEIKFSGQEALQRQIAEDVKARKQYSSKY